MTHLVEDQNRRKLNLAESKVKEVLPEYFQTDYPNLISLLEKYYDFMDSAGDQAFKIEIDNLITARDINQTSLENLDQLLGEIGNGLQASSFFDNPRLMAKLLGEFYRVKGSETSIKGFFRGFFNQEPVVEYPKRNLFVVGESRVGYESLKFIQDNRRYQIFSILVKSGISVSEYEFLYKKFVHPAGFYFAGEVVLENAKAFGVFANTGVDSDEIRGLADNDPILVSDAATVSTAQFTQLTAIIDSAGRDFRIVTDQFIETYADVTAGELESIYDNVHQIINPNSFTADDSAQYSTSASLAPSSVSVLGTSVDNEDGTFLLQTGLGNTITFTYNLAANTNYQLDGSWSDSNFVQINIFDSNNDTIFEQFTDSVTSINGFGIYGGSPATITPSISGPHRLQYWLVTGSDASITLNNDRSIIPEGGISTTVNTAVSLETMDNTMFTRYTSDSAI